MSDGQHQFCFLQTALVLYKARREKRTQHLMSIVSSSHTPQGRGEEKGANYKWPNPALLDFSGGGIGPPVHFGTGSALSGIRRGCREPRGGTKCEARRRGPVLRRALPAAPASRPPTTEATKPGVPAGGSAHGWHNRTGLSPAQVRSGARQAPCARCPVPGVRACARAAPGRGMGRSCSRLHKY